jgi:hypothetical protein
VTMATRPVRSNRLVKGSSRHRLGLDFQTEPKFIKIQPNPAKAAQRQSKQFSRILFDSVSGIVPFQAVAPTPEAFFLLSRTQRVKDRSGGVQYAPSGRLPRCRSMGS